MTTTAATRRLAPVPASAATNAYELFRDLERLLRDEPARFCYLLAWAVVRGRGRPLPTKRRPAAVPPCGTIGCYGGWLHLLLWPRLARRRRKLHHVVLFFEQAGGPALAEALRALFYRSAPLAPYGTRQYAAEGRRALRAFVRTWAAELRAIPLDRAALRDFPRRHP